MARGMKRETQCELPRQRSRRSALCRREQYCRQHFLWLKCLLRGAPSHACMYLSSTVNNHNIICMKSWNSQPNQPNRNEDATSRLCFHASRLRHQERVLSYNTHDPSAAPLGIVLAPRFHVGLFFPRSCVLRCGVNGACIFSFSGLLRTFVSRSLGRAFLHAASHLTLSL